MRAALSWAVVVVAVGFATWTVATRWDEVRQAVREVGAGPAVLALALVVAGLLCTAVSWRSWVRVLGHDLALSRAMALFFVTQLGKYVPGAVWPVVAQAGLAEREQLPRAALPTATTLFLVGHVSTGMLVGGALGALAGSPPGPLVLGAVGAAGAVLAAPRPWEAARSRVRGRLQRVVPDRLRRGPWWAGQLWLLAAWVAYGASLWVLVRALDLPGGAIAATAASALSWVAGFVVLVAPAGAGAREVVMAGLLGPDGGGRVVALVLAARVVTLLGDVLLAAVTWPWLRPRTASGPPDAATTTDRGVEE